MSSPVLEEIKTILVTVFEDSFKPPIYHCLGTNRSRNRFGQRCGNHISKLREDNATRLLTSFLELRVVPHDERFYDEIQEFLVNSHCRPHLEDVKPKFETWKTKRRGCATPTPTSPVVDENDEQDAKSDILNTPAASPGQESEYTFSIASPASTNLTTPGATPLDNDPSSKSFNALYDADHRPETPTPASRRPSELTADLEIANEVADVLAQYPDPKGPEALGVIRRFKSVKKQKWPLLKAIESKFTSDDYKKGRVYIWTRQNGEKLVKIGFTTFDSKARFEQPGNCYAKDAVRQWESEQPFVGARRVESIVRVDLGHSNIDVETCEKCNKSYREWFHMNDWRDARETIKVWTQFVKLAYTNGQLDERGKPIIDRLCSASRDMIVAELSASMGPSQADELPTVSEESESGQEAVVPEEPVTVLAGDEQVTVTANTAPSQPSTDPVSSDTTIDQDAVSPPTAQVSGKKRWARSFLSRTTKILNIKKRGGRSERSESSEQENGEREDDNEEIFSKLFKRFFSSELREEENTPQHSQPDPADTRDNAQSSNGNSLWASRLRSRKKVPASSS